MYAEINECLDQHEHEFNASIIFPQGDKVEYAEVVHHDQCKENPNNVKVDLLSKL